MDEFGFDRIEREECPQAAHLLYKVIARRHQKRSTILITNVDFDGWAQYLGDAPLAMAMLDRLVDGAVIIRIKGPSYRANRPGATRPVVRRSRRHPSTATLDQCWPPKWTSS